MFAYDTHISVDHEDVSTIEYLLSGQEKEKNIFFGHGELLPHFFGQRWPKIITKYSQSPPLILAEL